MPNVPPFGIYSSKRTINEEPPSGFSPAVDVKATLPNDVTTRQATEVWASNAAGVPRLVWARSADSPSTAVISYVAATPAAGGHVHMTWTNPTPIKSDGYRILRPDGSVAGTTTQLATSFDDPTPKPLSGTYKLAALLGGVADTTPGVSNTLNLSTAPTSFVAGTNSFGTAGHLTWGHPTYGKPHQYQVYRDGALYVTLDGGVLVYDDTNPTRGATHTYQVFALLSSVRGTGTSVSSVGFAPLDPATVSITDFGTPDLLAITFAYPGGAITRYEIQDYDSDNPGWVNQDLNNTSGSSSWHTQTSNGYMRVRSIGVNGLASNWVQVGPRPAIVPVPVILSYGASPAHPGDPFWLRAAVSATYSGIQPQICAQYYWANFPNNGWQGAGCQPGDNVGTVVVWDVQKLQLSPTYFRVSAIRNGVVSQFAQVGPL